jgi:hypothetical protein
MDFPGLASIEREWLKLFHELRGPLGPDRGQIAPLFLSVRPLGYDPLAKPSVLYIGKATNGQWNWKCDPRSLTVEKTREYTRSFILKEAETYNSTFWRFAGELSKRVAAANGQSNQLQNLVWTNLCKIGVVRGTPRERIVLAQRDLAVRTLRLEIEAYRPKLIVFVTGDFGDGIIAELVRDPEWKSWHHNGRKRQLGWWRKPIGQMPAILWADHPQGKPLAVREAWLNQVEQLLSQ